MAGDLLARIAQMTTKLTILPWKDEGDRAFQRSNRNVESSDPRTPLLASAIDRQFSFYQRPQQTLRPPEPNQVLRRSLRLRRLRTPSRGARAQAGKTTHQHG